MKIHEYQAKELFRKNGVAVPDGQVAFTAAEAKAAAVAEQLLTRHGVVTRDAVLAETVPGGFSGLYPVYAALEDAGRARRGYFIEGRGGAQFALPGAVDRLRAIGDTGIVTMSAVDPANPYGATLPWPDRSRSW